MANWLNLGQIYRVNASKYPRNLALMDHLNVPRFASLAAYWG